MKKLLLLLLLPSVVLAQVRPPAGGKSAVGADGVSTTPLTAPSFTSTAADTYDAFVAGVGAHLHLGTSELHYDADYNSIISDVAITAPDFRVTTDDINLYVDSVNGDDFNPGTYDLPLQTLPGALDVLPAHWGGAATISLAAGTYYISGAYTARIGTPVHGGKPLVIQGSMEDVGIGERTISSVTKLSNRVYRITDNTLAPTLDQYVGNFIYCPSQNLRRIIRTNSTAGMFELNIPDSHTSGGPAASDTFYVEQPAVTIQYNNTLTWTSSGVPNQVHVIFDQVKLQGVTAGRLNWDTGFNAWFQSSVINLAASGSNDMSLGWGARILAGQGTSTSVSSVLQTDWYGAGLFLGITTTGANAITVGPNSMLKGVYVLRGTNTTSMYFYVKGLGAYFDATTLASTWAYIVISNGGGLIHDIVYGQKGMVYVASATIGLPGITFSMGATGNISSMDLSNHPADALLVTDRSVLTYNNTIGTGSTGVGVSVQRGSVVVEGSGNTVTGTGGDVKVNAATSTHATIAGGTPLTDAAGGVASN